MVWALACSIFPCLNAGIQYVFDCHMMFHISLRAVECAVLFILRHEYRFSFEVHNEDIHYIMSLYSCVYNMVNVFIFISTLKVKCNERRTGAYCYSKIDQDMVWFWIRKKDIAGNMQFLIAKRRDTADAAVISWICLSFKLWNNNNGLHLKYVTRISFI